MIKVLLVVFISFLSSPSWSETVTMGDLVERNDLYFEKFTNTPFTGEVSGLGNGKFKKGQKNGEWLSYYENGQLKLKGTFKHGKEEGLWEYYHDNGKLELKGTFKDGKEEGLWETHHYDDYLTSKGAYKNGKRNGIWKGYYKNDQLRYKGKYINGKTEGFWVWFTEYGSQEKAKIYKNGVLQ